MSRNRLSLLVASAVLVVLVGSVVVLGLVDVAPPQETVEKTIPNDRFSR
ncbi:MAG: hypothetical protein HKM95_12310 [Inquilinus sp.]|nr:hypothetical protein [Inquilinus sp.]